MFLGRYCSVVKKNNALVNVKPVKSQVDMLIGARRVGLTELKDDSKDGHKALSSHVNSNAALRHGVKVIKGATPGALVNTYRYYNGPRYLILLRNNLRRGFLLEIKILGAILAVIMMG